MAILCLTHLVAGGEKMSYREGAEMIAKGLGKIVEKLLLDLMDRKRGTITGFIKELDILVCKEILKEVKYYLDKGEIEKAKKIVNEIVG